MKGCFWARPCFSECAPPPPPSPPPTRTKASQSRPRCRCCCCGQEKRFYSPPTSFAWPTLYRKTSIHRRRRRRRLSGWSFVIPTDPQKPKEICLGNFNFFLLSYKISDHCGRGLERDSGFLRKIWPLWGSQEVKKIVAFGGSLIRTKARSVQIDRLVRKDLSWNFLFSFQWKKNFGLSIKMKKSLVILAFVLFASTLVHSGEETIDLCSIQS